VRTANRSLGAAILGIADNLIICNDHFGQLVRCWKAQGKDPRHSRIKLACGFCRIASHMVAGRQVFRHRSIPGRHYILDKLNTFHREHQTPLEQTTADLLAVIAHVPRAAHADEANRSRTSWTRARPAGGGARNSWAIFCQ
jgi:hypothetical protein